MANNTELDRLRAIRDDLAAVEAADVSHGSRVAASNARAALEAQIGWLERTGLPVRTKDDSGVERTVAPKRETRKQTAPGGE